jgi:hypothetical protein
MTGWRIYPPSKIGTVLPAVKHDPGTWRAWVSGQPGGPAGAAAAAAATSARPGVDVYLLGEEGALGLVGCQG